MASLSDLQKRASQGLTRPTASTAFQAVGAGMGMQPPSQQPALGQLVGVATTGKAAPTPGEGPAASNIQELLAQQGIQQETTAVARAATEADKEQALKEQEAYLKLDDEAFNTRENAIRTKGQLQQKFDELMTDLEARRGQLDMEDEADRIEQVMQLARLGNDKYINKLQLEGARARLDSEINFREALMNSAFSSNQDLLRKNFSFRSALLADEKRFREELANMNIDIAMKLLEGDLETAQSAAAYQAAATGVSAVTAAGKEYLTSKSPTYESKADTYKVTGKSTDYVPPSETE